MSECPGCEVCELATELAEERMAHAACHQDLAEQRALLYRCWREGHYTDADDLWAAMCAWVGEHPDTVQPQCATLAPGPDVGWAHPDNPDRLR